MKIEMDKDLANTILEVQHVLKKNSLEIGGPAGRAKWEELVRISSYSVTKGPSFNITGCQSGRFFDTETDHNMLSRVQSTAFQMDNDILEAIVEAAYAWRAADVHSAACKMCIREGDPEEAEDICQKKLSELRIVLDKYKPHSLLDKEGC